MSLDSNTTAHTRIIVTAPTRYPKKCFFCLCKQTRHNIFGICMQSLKSKMLSPCAILRAIWNRMKKQEMALIYSHLSTFIVQGRRVFPAIIYFAFYFLFAHPIYKSAHFHFVNISTPEGKDYDGWGFKGAIFVTSNNYLICSFKFIFLATYSDC